MDLIRYPFLRLGIDYDLYLGNIKLLDRKSSDPTRWTAFSVQGREPMTIGVHGMAIPFRVRGVPVTVQARARFPIPLVQKDQDAKITDWEISGGLRPAIWETSLYGHTYLCGGFKWWFSVGKSRNGPSFGRQSVSPAEGSLARRIHRAWTCLLTSLSTYTNSHS